jgi:hypothetical protein
MKANTPAGNREDSEELICPLRTPARLSLRARKSIAFGVPTLQIDQTCVIEFDPRKYSSTGFAATQTNGKRILI